MKIEKIKKKKNNKKFLAIIDLITLILKYMGLNGFAKDKGSIIARGVW